MVLTRFGLQGFENSYEALDIYDPRDNPEEAPDEALFAMGTNQVLEGDKLVGIQLLELAIQKNPRNHEALNNLAFVIIDSDLERAFELANRAVAQSPNQAAYLDTRGTIYMKMGQYKKAINDFEDAIDFDRRFKSKVEVYEKLVVCFTELGMVKQAEVRQRKIDELRGQGGQ